MPNFTAPVVAVVMNPMPVRFPVRVPPVRGSFAARSVVRFVTADSGNDDYGTTGAQEKVLTPAMVSLPVLCTTAESVALAARSVVRLVTFDWAMVPTPTVGAVLVPPIVMVAFAAVTEFTPPPADAGRYWVGTRAFASSGA